ncbi:hypothetical protein [Saccharomonospora sp.]|uniref:alpha/beta fold hydrolase n=1 Tax=Saccharomonospora sp. TaxID=33913 RepID=UPI0034377590
MVLDSPVLSATDVDTVRAYRRRLLWQGDDRPATLVRELIDSATLPMNEVGHVVSVVYEFAGPTTLERLLAARLRGKARRTWRWINSLGAKEMTNDNIPMVLETDLVAGIAHGTLGFGAGPDGLPLDPRAGFADTAAHAPAFTGDAVDLPAHLPHFTWPTAVVSGERDLRTPRPIAERTASLLPNAVLVELPDTGHSALDTHQLAALHIAHRIAAGNLDTLAQQAPASRRFPDAARPTCSAPSSRPR